ncbi:type II toxin-antitoxin system RelE/ParE family toxin [Labrys monachus]|uniref:Plasmid stabilization system protein ParE n=1 Tax=Labrys monachus TaxID=217067 RepID=A0ABU0FP13_9HYPH|nr:type II toxin-antitoxin system RelE/ParE family toxin [Labrys monachus]MDQ0396358.1 plasmid stabilization system protein ParE [Labrys monachus]
MKIVYLAGTTADIAWMRNYYAHVFPEGRKRAREHFKAAEALLSETPLIGRTTAVPEVRELVIPRTPFSFLYRVRPERIEILRIWDGRADRPPKFGE